MTNGILFAQSKRVAITIDDAPYKGTSKYDLTSSKQQAVNNAFLNVINELKTPVALFINGSECLSRVNTLRKIKTLRRWIDNPLITLGNHTLNHLNHSKTDYETFIEDVITCDHLIRSFAANKPLRYFRFPYNALGKDSTDQYRKAAYLASRNYILTPFTIESIDYMYCDVYMNELKKGNKKRADSIADAYIDYTIKTFINIEEQTQELHGRSMNHIFLCHVNPLNVRCYKSIINKLKDMGYGFITLEEALTDPIYGSTNYYHSIYGISWLYRWIPDKATRKKYQQRGPDDYLAIYREYEQLHNPEKK